MDSLGIKLRNQNPIPERNRANPPQSVDTDVAINPMQDDLGNLPSAVERVTGIGAGSNQETNHVRQQQAGSEVSSQAAGFDSPWIQPEDVFNYLMFGVIRRHVNPTSEEQRDNPAHHVQADVAINLDRSNDNDNQASAVGGVTEFSTSNEQHVNDAVQQHINEAVQQHINEAVQQHINEAVHQHVGRALSDQGAGFAYPKLQMHRYRPFGLLRRCINPLHRDYRDNRYCCSDPNWDHNTDHDNNNQPSAVRRVTEFNLQQNISDHEAYKDQTTSESSGLGCEAVLMIKDDSGSGLRRSVTLQVHDLILKLKEAVVETVCIPAERQVWLFNNRELCDTDSLAMIGFRARQAIEVMDRQLLPPGWIKTAVRPLSI